jgi:uncharacterized UPF0160 family protein
MYANPSPPPNLGVQYSDADIELVYAKMYDSFLEELDAVDNGIEQYADEVKATQKYKANSSLPQRISGLNRRWNEDGGASGCVSPGVHTCADLLLLF